MSQTRNWIHRLYFHFYRYKTVLLIIGFMLTFAVFFYGLMYPGEENLETYISYLSILGTISLENPGYSFWMTLAVNMALTIFTPLLAIYLGVNILPFGEQDGKEYLFSTPKSTTKFLLENTILVIGLMIITLIPAYLLSGIYLIINQSLDILENISIGFILILIMSLVILFLTALGSSLTFSKSGGYKLGGGYFVFSFLIDQTRPMEEFSYLRDLSVYSRAEAISHSFLGKWNEEFLLIATVMIVILVVLTGFILYRKDVLEGGLQTKGKESIEENSEEKDKFAFVKKPVDTIVSRMGWKRPILRDQLHANAGVFTIFFVFLTMISAYTVLLYFQGGESGMSTILVSLDQPMINAAMFNHRFASTIDPLAYIIAIEVLGFAWMSFGPFLLYSVYNLTTRDYRNNYSESTWILPKSGAKIILNRTLAGLTYIILLFSGSFLAILSAEVVFGVYTNLEHTILGFIAATWTYCVIFVFFVFLTILFHPKNALKTITLGFFFAIFIVIMGFMSNFEPLIYLSPFGYFDFVGVFLGTVDFIEFIPAALIGTGIICLLYVYALKVHLARQDYLA